MNAANDFYGEEPISLLSRKERISFLNQFEVYDLRYFIKPKIKNVFPSLSLWRTEMYVVEANGNMGLLIDMIFHGDKSVVAIVPDDVFLPFIDGDIGVVDFYTRLSDFMINHLIEINDLFVSASGDKNDGL